MSHYMTRRSLLLTLPLTRGAARIVLGDPETVVVILGDGPYFSGLYHRQGCWWVARSARPQILWRAEAEAGLFRPHEECMSKPAGASSAAPKGAPPIGAPSSRYVAATTADSELVHVRLSTPYLNGLYHRVGCWWLMRAGRGETRSLQRGDAERRYFQAHQECMNKPPAGNSTPPPEFANEGAVARGEVSLSSFERIGIGMSESEVERIFGSSGETVSESQIGGTSLLMRRWEAREGVAVISFRDGRVVSKNQFGLK